MQNLVFLGPSFANIEVAPVCGRDIFQGNSFGIIPGGFQEATLSKLGTDRVWMKNRKGLIKVHLASRRLVKVFQVSNCWIGLKDLSSLQQQTAYEYDMKNRTAQLEVYLRSLHLQQVATGKHPAVGLDWSDAQNLDFRSIARIGPPPCQYDLLAVLS